MVRLLAVIFVFLASAGSALAGGQTPNLAIANTPTDPVAGNPASLQARMVTQSFNVGTSVGPATGFQAVGPGGASLGGQFGLGVGTGSYSHDGREITFTELPFSYARPLADPRYAIIVDAPLTYIESDDYNLGGTSESLSFSPGVALRVPISDDWDITPGVRVGAIWSDGFDFFGDGINSYLYGASISSNYTATVGDFTVTIGNHFSQTATIDRSDNDYDFTTNVWRNGVAVARDTPLDFFGLPVNVAASAIYTQNQGADLFTQNVAEYTVTIGTSSSVNGVQWDNARIGVTYTDGDNGLEGWRVDFGSRF